MAELRKVRFHESGTLQDSFIDRLLIGASAVIFPSTHEGFGLPILKGLGYRKPVIARSLPVTRELAGQLGHPRNLLLYSSTSNLVDLLRAGVPEWQPEAISNDHGWDAATAQIAGVLEQALQNIQYEEVLMPRIRYSQGGFSNREMEYRVADLENSMSWRITRPLRLLADLFLRIQKAIFKAEQ
jgi:hypothetical protein